MGDARNVICGEDGKCTAPEDLEAFSEAIGFMGCNNDGHIQRKLQRLNPPVHEIIPYESRQMLVELATQEYDWLWFKEKPFEAFEELQRQPSQLHIKHFEVIGADNSLYTKPWRRVTDTERIILMGRPADPGENNGTEAMHRAMRKDNYDITSTSKCIMGPELADISSTAARKALWAGDVERLRKLLHPAVMDWNLNEGPYAP